MAKVAPFHSSKTKDKYHDCSNCTEGNNIEKHYKTQGTGGLPRCKNCEEREKKGTC
jgi:hypothetical protein